MNLRVASRTQRSARVISLELRDEKVSELPAFDPGAHVEVVIPHLGGPLVRHDSLVSDPAERRSYTIAVLRADDSRGGSDFLHDHVRVGDSLTVSEPRNEFPLRPGAEHVVLLAGGIGITALLGMARHLVSTGRSFELHYAARTPEELVFRRELEAMRLPQCHYHAPGRASLDLVDLLGHAPPVTHVYVCGPRGLIEATRDAARRLKWDEGRVHRESFGPSANRGDGKLRVRLAQSGIDLDVAPGTTLLDALVLAGAFLAYDCRRGECGSCAVRVLEGRPVHRDVCLSDEARRTLLCTCVSWAEGAELTLDV